MKIKSIFIRCLFLFFFLTYVSCSKDNEDKSECKVKNSENKDNVAIEKIDDPEIKSEVAINNKENPESKEEVPIKKTDNPESKEESKQSDLQKKLEISIAELEKLREELKNANSQLKEKDNMILMNEDVIKKRQENEDSLFWFVGVLFLLITITFFLFLIIYINISKRKALLETLVHMNKKLQNKIKSIESEYSSNINRSTFKSSTLESSLFGASKINEESDFSMEYNQRQKIETKTFSPDFISLLYNDKKGRDARKMSGDIFLDIAQVMYMKMQRNERITSVILEKQGTWRNSMFVLIGKSLYLNFHSYNETRSFCLESVETEELMHLIYDIEGEGNIIKCEPAIVSITKGSYSVITKGKLLLT